MPVDRLPDLAPPRLGPRWPDLAADGVSENNPGDPDDTSENGPHRPMKKTHPLIPLSLAAAMLVAVPAASLASGSYTARPPVPGLEEGEMDRAKYALGQKLLTGKVKPGPEAQPEVDTEAQRARLNVVQAQLPSRITRKTNVTLLAGRLTAEQLESLEYYVKRRYGKG